MSSFPLPTPNLPNSKTKTSSFPPPTLLLLLLSLLPLPSSARPHALLAPITKDPKTLQYLTNLTQRTPPHPLLLVLDLAGPLLWLDCDSPYLSSSYRPAPCRSSLCSLARSTACGDCFSSPRPGCNNNTCGAFPENPFTRTSTSGELALDSLSLPSTDGSSPSSPVSDPSFLFSCAPRFLTNGLASDASGIAGLARTRIALPSQLASHFSFRRQFALCLPSRSVPGILFFGPGPYNFLPNIDASKSLTYTPLLTNPISTAGTFQKGEPSYEYFIGVSGIKIGDNVLSLNETLLRIDRKTGYGGTKISTAVAYTTLERSIYRTVTEAFAAALANVTRVAAVAPFELCYDERELGSTRVGPGVPAVFLELGKKNVFWSVYGGNSMVEVKSGVLCFGFLDGGLEPRTSIVIGGYQLEDNLVEFDLAYSRIGFSGSLLFQRTTCANFNFTVTS